MKVTAQVFLSYAREDEEKVEKLYQKLSDAGFKPWMDKKDILPGEKWKSRIQKAIRRSDFFLACLSANSLSKRGFLQKEIKDALDIWQEMLDSDIYLIPVRLEDCEVPERLRDFQWVNLFEEDGWAWLVKAIQIGMERRRVIIKPKETKTRPKSEEERQSLQIHREDQKEARRKTRSYLLLSPWSPLDYLRLLWWLVIAPQRLNNYEEQFGEGTLRRVGRWLASTFIYLPLLLPTLALGLETLPLTEDSRPAIFLWLSGGLVLAWLLTGWGDGGAGSVVGLLVAATAGGGMAVYSAVGLVGGMACGVVVGLAVGLAVGLVSDMDHAVSVAIVTGLVIAFVGAVVVTGILSDAVKAGTVAGALIAVTLFVVCIIISYSLTVEGTLGLADVVKESIKTGCPSWLARVSFGALPLAYAFLVWFSFLGGWQVFR